MIDAIRPCAAIAKQPYAVEMAVLQARRVLIHAHIDHCLTGGPSLDIAEIKALTRFP